KTSVEDRRGEMAGAILHPPSSSIQSVLGKQFVHAELAPEHALLVGELDQVFHVVAVFLQALVEWILAEEFSFRLEIRASPGKAQAVRLFHEFIIRLACGDQRLVQAGGDPWVAV